MALLWAVGGLGLAPGCRLGSFLLHDFSFWRPERFFPWWISRTLFIKPNQAPAPIISGQSSSRGRAEHQCGREVHTTHTEGEGRKCRLSNRLNGHSRHAILSLHPLSQGLCTCCSVLLEHSIYTIQISPWKSPSSEKLPLAPHCELTPSPYAHSTFFANLPKAQCLEL